MMRLLLPLAFCCLGIALLTGCWHATNEYVSPGSPHQPIGSFTRWSLRVGRTTRADTIAKLGKPTEEVKSPDGASRMLFRWDLINESGIGTLCGFTALGGQSDYSKTLKLEFGPDEKLKSKTVEDSRTTDPVGTSHRRH